MCYTKRKVMGKNKRPCNETFHYKNCVKNVFYKLFTEVTADLKISYYWQDTKKKIILNDTGVENQRTRMNEKS